MKSFLCGLIAGVALPFSLGAASAQQLVKVGYEFNQPPLYWVEGKAFAPTGAMVDVADAVAKDVGFRIEWHIMAGTDRMALHAAKAIDLSLGQLTPERLAVLDAADPIYAVGEALFTRKDNAAEYKTLDDLRGENVVSGAALADQVQKAGLGIFKELKPVPAPGLYLAVISGEAKAGFVNALALWGVLKENTYPDIKMVATYQPRFNNPGGIMANRGQAELLSKINTALAKLKSNGIIASAFAKQGVEFAVAK
jgi:polar amino acid transport system substrate-binding protein